MTGRTACIHCGRLHRTQSESRSRFIQVGRRGGGGIVEEAENVGSKTQYANILFMCVFTFFDLLTWLRWWLNAR